MGEGVLHMGFKNIYDKIRWRRVTSYLLLETHVTTFSQGPNALERKFWWGWPRFLDQTLYEHAQ